MTAAQVSHAASDALHDHGQAAYALGVQCTWHNLLRLAAIARKVKDGESVLLPVCPNCSSELRETTVEAFLADVRSGEQRLPEYSDMMAWSRGRCFPDFDILQNAYRQAMEE